MNVPKKVLSSLVASPLLFPLLQLPEASIDLVESFLGKHFEQQPVFALLLLLPYFWVASTLSTALTFAAVVESEQGRRPTLMSAFRVVEPRLVPLLAASALAGVVILLGLTAMILPGVYFMAIYLFVPFYVLRDSERQSAFAVLNRSKKLAEKRLISTLTLTLLVIVVGIAFHFGGEYLGAQVGKLVESPALAQTLFFAVKVFLSAFVGATMNVAVSHFFLSLAPIAPPTSPA